MAAVLPSSMFFGLLHFSLGSVIYGFFFGYVFTLVRVITGNLAYTMLMHVTFNSLNVLLGYVNIGVALVWVVIAVMAACIVGFVILMKKLLHETSIHVGKKRHKIRPPYDTGRICGGRDMCCDYGNAALKKKGLYCAKELYTKQI